MTKLIHNHTSVAKGMIGKYSELRVLLNERTEVRTDLVKHMLLDLA